MQQNKQRGDAKTERHKFTTKFNQLSWDDLKIFLVCVELGSFRKAATELHLSSSTVVRRIERLEIALEQRLFDRLPDGIVLNTAGQAILARAQRMEGTANDITRISLDHELLRKEDVTVSITEGIGTYWVMPHLVKFQQHHPQILVNLFCAMESADVLRLEADMAIQFTRPTSPNLIVVKLGRLHLHAFAAQSYIDMYGKPDSITELVDHKFVQQVAPQLDDSILAGLFGFETIAELISIRANTSTAHFYAIEKGAGIGVLPTFAAALNAPVIPLDVARPHHLDVWLTFHPDVRKQPRKAQVISWLKDIFDPRIYPWFRDEFIHPIALSTDIPEEALANVNEGYFSVNPKSISRQGEVEKND